jgi:hypothetical protein
MTGLSFTASIHKIATTVDGGCNLTLSIPQSERDQIKQLFDLMERTLQIGIVDQFSDNTATMYEDAN